MSQASDRVASISDKLRQRLEIVARNELSDRDIEYFIDILVMRTALLYDLLDGSTQAEITATWERTILGLSVIDVELYSRDWKMLREIVTSSQFLSACAEGQTAAIEAFKLAASGNIHYKWIFNSALLLVESEGDWYRKANQWIVFDSHANLTTLDLQTECVAEYVAFEDDLSLKLHETNQLSSGLAYDSYMDPYFVGSEEQRDDAALCRYVARDLFGDFRITDYAFRPKHGNGATAEVARADADPWHKNRHFAVDAEIITYLKYRIAEEDWHDWFYIPYKGLSRTCSLVCVPKSMTSNRTISKEPTTLQFLQQDIARALDDFFQEHKEIYIDLHDQSRSRELARVGSSDGSYATIDLSSASDSVSAALVEFLFGNLPMYYPLMATRSNSVRLPLSNDDGDNWEIPLEKFAPMGSSTCFPVESMVFTTICEAAVRSVSGRKSRYGEYQVYGDDIVIKTPYAQKTIELLTMLGFKVNEQKSFGLDEGLDTPPDSWRFREACGIEALNGRDITPLRLSRRLVSLTSNDSDHQAGLGVGFVDLLNRCYLYGYWTLRRWVNDSLIKHKWYRTCLRLPADDYRQFADAVKYRRKSHITVSIPFVITDETSATQWRAFGSSTGLLNRYHRCSALVTTAKDRSRMRAYHDDNDYYTWCLRARTEPVDDDIFDIDDTGFVTIRPRDLKWSKEWVSLQRPAQLQRYCPYR